jgi:hypothetical protein
METTNFDRLTTSFATTSSRRSAVRFLAAAILGAGGLAVLHEEETGARRKTKKHHHGHGGHGEIPHAPRALRQTCDPSRDSCSSGLQCSTPTTRHTCSSTVAGIESWCCVPPQAVCAGECDCCGNFYCSFENGATGYCIPNPEG